MKNCFCFFDSAIGRLGVAERDGFITEVILPGGPLPKDAEIAETPLLHQAIVQINMFLEGRSSKFDLPLSPEGTDFQKAVWSEIAKIPPGETRTYKNIAMAIGKEHATRAVGSACHQNPIPIIIPCHRVLGVGGSLIGYNGGLELKEKLLNFESLIRPAPVQLFA